MLQSIFRFVFSKNTRHNSLHLLVAPLFILVATCRVNFMRVAQMQIANPPRATLPTPHRRLFRFSYKMGNGRRVKVYTFFECSPKTKA